MRKPILLGFFIILPFLLHALPGQRKLSTRDSKGRDTVSVKGIQGYENGLAAFDRQQYDSAFSFFNDAYEKYRNQDALFFRGYARLKLGDIDSARYDLSTLIRIDSLYRHAFYMRGLINAASQQHEAAIADYKVQMQILPDYWKSYAACGRSLLALKRYSEAALVFGQSNDRKFTDSVAVLEAKAYFLNTDYKRVIETADKYAREGEFSDPQLYMYKGLAYFRQGLFQESVTELLISADLNPDNAEVHRMLVENYLVLSDPEKAVKSAVNYSKYTNNSPEALLLEGICRISEQKVMSYADAIAKITEAVRLDSTLNTAANNAWIAYGYLLSKKEINRFSTYIQVAKRKNTKDPIVLFVQACSLADSESNSDLVFRYLELACEGGFPYNFMLQHDPDLVRFEKNKTYRTIVEQCKPVAEK